MATAFLPLANLFAALQEFAAWFAPRPAPVPRIAVRATPPRPMAQPAPRVQAKPLRIVRVFEPSTPRAGAGRMVISGRMADVCAELDRLAAQEARGR